MKWLVRCTALALPLLLLMSHTPLAAAQYGGRSFNFASTTYNSRWAQQDGSMATGTVRVQQIQQYRQQSSDLQNKISALPSSAVASVPMPVLFGVAVSDLTPNFGDPRDNGTRTHEGEDIMAVSGTPIVSPTAAVVLRTVTGPDEGNAVYTANPGGETFVYMHLDHFGEGVSAGTVLKQGSLIGYVGNTGNASGGPAHLHFEIHNSSGTPIDPFPRLTGELSLKEKIADLFTILTQTSNRTALAEFLVTNFRGTFLTAIAATITLPAPITDALASITATPVSLIGTGGTLPAGDLDIGSTGAAVVTLQKYLIQAATGAAATSLASAGATGYFGVMTKAALVEFQVLAGITPPAGYYGPKTRAFIAAHPQGAATSPAPSTTPGTSTATVTRDLHEGVSGEDVRALQKLLNANGYVAAVSGAGSPGNETTYFGPATRAAVIKFQIAHSIIPAVGYVGSLTRAALANL